MISDRQSHLHSCLPQTGNNPVPIWSKGSSGSTINYRVTIGGNSKHLSRLLVGGRVSVLRHSNPYGGIFRYKQSWVDI